MNARFEHEVNSFRADKDFFLRKRYGFSDSSERTLQLQRVKLFSALPYFFEAGTTRYAQAVCDSYQHGNPTGILRYGTLTFNIKGTSLRLLVFKSTEDPYSRSLFIPFSDATSGKETCMAGRYLDLEEYGGDAHEMDFNMAYNPYYAYSGEYTCPMHPVENSLPVRTLAGQKNYK